MRIVDLAKKLIAMFYCSMWGSGLLLLSFSCMPDPLEVMSVPQIREQIVVSTQIIPDQSLLVLLTRTFGALEAGDDSDPRELLDLIAVNDALVTLEGPHGKDTLKFLGMGAYASIIIPFVEGEEYHLYVNSHSLGEVYATSEVKPTIEFEQVDAELFLMDSMIPWHRSPIPSEIHQKKTGI